MCYGVGMKTKNIQASREQQEDNDWQPEIDEDKDYNNCIVQAVRYCFDMTYDEAYYLLKSLGRKDNHGCLLWNLAPKLGLEAVYVSPRAAEPLGRPVEVPPETAEWWRGLQTMLPLVADHNMKLGEALAKYSTENWIIGVAYHALAVVDGKNMDRAGTGMNESVFYVFRPIS